MSFTHYHGSRRSGSGNLFRIVGLAAALSLLATLVLPTGAQALEQSQLDGQTVYLVNAATGRFLDADSNGTVDQSAKPGQDDQWQIDEVRPGVFSFRNVQRGRLLDADGADRGFDVNLSNNLESDTEWELNGLDDGSYEIRNVEYGQWLDADYGDRGYAVNLTTGFDEPDARWFLLLATSDVSDLEGAVVMLANAGTGRWLDTDEDGSVDQSVGPKVDDQWVTESDGAGNFFTFRNRVGDRLLHADDASNNYDVNLNALGGADSQWSVTLRRDGTAEILNSQAGLWLDGDYGNKNYNVDLTPNVNDPDGRWNIFVLATDDGCVSANFDSIDSLLRCVDAGDAFVHLAALQAIADANGGVRASGTPGYDASVDYVANLLQQAGYIVELQTFDFTLFNEISSSLSADGVDLETQTMSFSPSGTVVDGNIVPVDLDLGLDNASTSGCEIEDFAELDFSGSNDIALMQRGACAFSTKALNAQEAGAEAAIVFNQGNTEERRDIIGATLGEATIGVLTIPVLDTAYESGEILATALAASLSADTTSVTRPTQNVIADWPGANPGNVVMAGAHLDSVPEGPGIQDNGSGSTALLAIALTLANNAEYTPQNSLRFAWWGAEEAGLIGSNEYIFNPEFGITDEEYAALAAYINFDMVASPNFIHGVYDADQSTFEAPVPVPEGSAALEDLFEAYFSIEGVPYEDTAFSGRSDYQAFINVNIPASGLFTGAEEIKTEQQAAIWGGTAGDQFDPCYHLACDTLDNVSYVALEDSIDAIAYAIYNLAASTQAVNGVVGVPVVGQTPADVVLDGPQGTFVAGGGGLSPDHDHDHSTGEPE